VTDPDLLARFAVAPDADDEPPAVEADEPEFDPYAWADAYDWLADERAPLLAGSGTSA
jgi:hypothetical protein